MFYDYETSDAIEGAIALAIELADDEDQREEWPGVLAKMREVREHIEAARRREDPLHAMIDDGVLPGGLYAAFPRYGSSLYHAMLLGPHDDDRPNLMRLRSLCRRFDTSDRREAIVRLETWEHLMSRSGPGHKQVCRRCEERAANLAANLGAVAGKAGA